eukprot:gene12043-13286_t
MSICRFMFYAIYRSQNDAKRLMQSPEACSPGERGDQSYRYYQDRQSWTIYDTEFSPDKPKVELRVQEDKGSDRKSVKEKLENIRQSWFNPEKFDQEEFYNPAQKKDGQTSVKDKFTSWRRSWFGPTDSLQPASPERKLSAHDKYMTSHHDEKDLPSSVVYRDQNKKLSQSGINRLSVTRSFVQRLGQADEVYGKQSKGGASPKLHSGEEKSNVAESTENVATTEVMVNSHSDQSSNAEADSKMEAFEGSSAADARVEIEEKMDTHNGENGMRSGADTDQDFGQENRETSSNECLAGEVSRSEDSETEADPKKQTTTTTHVRITSVVSTPKFDRPRVYTGASRYNAEQRGNVAAEAGKGADRWDNKSLSNDSNDSNSD